MYNVFHIISFLSINIHNMYWFACIDHIECRGQSITFAAFIRLTNLYVYLINLLPMLNVVNK